MDIYSGVQIYSFSHKWYEVNCIFQEYEHHNKGSKLGSENSRSKVYSYIIFYSNKKYWNPQLFSKVAIIKVLIT